MLMKNLQKMKMILINNLIEEEKLLKMTPLLMNNLKQFFNNQNKWKIIK